MCVQISYIGKVGDIMMYEYEPIGRYVEYGTEMCLSDAISVINSCENGNGKIRELVVKG